MRKNINYLTTIPLPLITSSGSYLRWNGKQPQGLISPEKADRLKMNYEKNQYRFINNSVADDSIIYGEETIFEREVKSFGIDNKNTQNNIDLDTREAWFSFNEIVGYLTMAQKHADKMGYENLGIRIYFGSYIKGGKPKTTVFFVATYRKPNDSTIHKTLSLKSGSQQLIDTDDPELQEDMEGIDRLNYGGSRRPPYN
jgi:hypothetical protein